MPVSAVLLDQGAVDQGAVDQGAVDQGAVDEGAVEVSSAHGNIVCGKVARLRDAGSVGRYKLPLWPQADKSRAHATTQAAATQPLPFVA